METRVILSQGTMPFLAANQAFTCFGPTVNNALLGNFWNSVGDAGSAFFGMFERTFDGVGNATYMITTGVGSGVGSYAANPNNIGGLLNTVGAVSGVPIKAPDNAPLPMLQIQSLLSNPIVLIGIAGIAYFALKK